MAGLAPKGQHLTFDPERHCGVLKVKRDGTPCLRSKGYGTKHLGIGVCKFHGGNMRSHIVSAGRIIAQKQLDRLGVPLQQDPQQALLEMVWEAAGNVAFLRQEVGKLGADIVEELTQKGHRGGETSMGDQERAMVRLYGDWTDKLTRYSKAAIDAGIAERQVQLAEAQGYAIRDLIEAVLDALDITDEQRIHGREVAKSKLRLLGAGVAA